MSDGKPILVEGDAGSSAEGIYHSLSSLDFRANLLCSFIYLSGTEIASLAGDLATLDYLWVPIPERRAGLGRDTLRKFIFASKNLGAKHVALYASAVRDHSDPFAPIDADLVKFYRSEGFRRVTNPRVMLLDIK